jgi:hypothetical protein
MGRPGRAQPLGSPEQLRATIESSGFAIEHWNDLSDQAASVMQTLLTLPPNPLGLHAFVTDFAEKAKNLTAARTAPSCPGHRTSNRQRRDIGAIAHASGSPLDGVGGWVFTRDIEHTFENRVILMMREVLL